MSNVSLRIEDNVAHVTLTRGDKMNALSFALMDELVAAGESLMGRDDVRAVVLSGEGKSFCAGMDVATFAKLSGMDMDEAVMARTHGNSNLFQQVAMVWRKLPMPVICAIQGSVFGAGLQIAIAADVRIAAPDTKMSVMEMKWGLIPDMGGMALLPQLVRSDVLRRLTYAAAPIDAVQAEKWGLVTEIAEKPLEVAQGLAAEITMKSPSAIRAAKRLVAFAEDHSGDQDAVLMEESREQVALIGKADQMEVVMAFMQKRAPKFS